MKEKYLKDSQENSQNPSSVGANEPNPKISNNQKVKKNPLQLTIKQISKLCKKS